MSSLSINPNLIKKILDSYSDSSAYSNYQQISHDYYKLYFKVFKKYNNMTQDKLRLEVKKWFFNQSLESRIKLCTVENEFFSQIIYKMYLYSKSDKTMKFYIKPEFTDKSEFYNQNNILDDYNENNEDVDFEFENFFNCKSEKTFSLSNNYNLLSGDIYTNEEEDDQKYNSSIDEFINEIIFYSVHHKPHPDCFCLSPYFLLKEERFDTTFNFLGNINYFSELIQPFYLNESNIYGYKLPSWVNNIYSYSITQFIFAFIEQAIMIKFLLNNYIYNNKKKNYNKNNEINASIFSLINDENLNQIFLDRKTVIKYLNINYNDSNSKIDLINNSKLDIVLEKLLKNNNIMNKIAYYKNFKRKKNYDGFAGSMLVQPLLGINSNNCIYNTLYDNVRTFLLNNPKEQNNFIINKIKSNIKDIIERTDNIIFVDYLLFQSFKTLWEIDYFINIEIIEYLINLFNEQNYNDLLKEETQSKKKNRRKKKKKNQNNDVIENSSEKNNYNNTKENENKSFNLDSECYYELFKDKEKLMFIPYYFSSDSELRKKFNKIKENKLKMIEKMNQNKKIQEINEIFNYIKNDFLLKYLIDKVIHLQPDNYVQFFDNNKEKKNENTEKNINKIHGLKLRKSKNNIIKTLGDFGTITINLNNKINNIINKNEKNTNNINSNKEESIENNNNKNSIVKEELIKKNIKNINITNKEEFIKENKMINTENHTNINVFQNKKQNNIFNNEEENSNNTIIENPNNNKLESKHLINEKNSNIKKNKKRKKSPIFFLFNTIKSKNKKKPKSKSPINNKLQKNNDFGISFFSQNIKSSESTDNNNFFFLENLHNNILKNKIKVDNILENLSKYKNYCIEKIKKIIINTYNNDLNNYSIELYGSFKTGLMIETSDIDIKIKINDLSKKDFEKYFFILNNKLEDEKKFETITPIITAKVPIIKLLINIEKFINNEEELEKDFIKFKQSTEFKNYLFDKKELLELKVDITFIKNINNLEVMNRIQNNKMNLNLLNNFQHNNFDNEISSISYINMQLKEYPEIKPILRLLKRYFYNKKMNSSFEGGLSSYNLFLLILSYSKYQKIYNLNSDKTINLGYFLIQFLQFFSFFDFNNFLININSPNIYDINIYINDNVGKSLIIIDPITGVNASKSSYKILEIQKMFLNAYNYFEKEKINYLNEIKKNEKNENNHEPIFGLNKINKNDYNKKNHKDNKICKNIIDKFFFS